MRKIKQTYLPQEEYLQRYKWIDYDHGVGEGPLALVTYRDRDILLELVNGEPSLLDVDRNPDIYYNFNPVTKKIAEYVKIWTKSGFYRSMHLKEFLDEACTK